MQIIVIRLSIMENSYRTKQHRRSVSYSRPNIVTHNCTRDVMHTPHTTSILTYSLGQINSIQYKSTA